MPKNLERRKRVMQRSMRLGHCICDPHLSCPCEPLKSEDICHCAGERREPSETGPVRLTQLVEKAGCASKVDRATLHRIIDGLPFPTDKRVLIGAPAGDDAGVFQLENGSCLVQTVDVFSPCVDDPYTFGQIAAANSVSDIYAMGGEPLTALSILAFPAETTDPAIAKEILRGGLAKMAEAGVSVIGGHTLVGREIAAGFAVTGVIQESAVTARAGAQPGDALILTKTLGTGIIAFGAQIGRATAEAREAAANSMAGLNRSAARIMREHGARACTDVTGFSLLGHLGAMAKSSGVNVKLVWDAIPLLPQALELAAAGCVPGATERNRESMQDQVLADEGLDPVALDIGFDPQTSGGLLIAIEPSRAETLLNALQSAGVSAARVIGSVIGPGDGRIHFVSKQQTASTIREPARPVEVSKPVLQAEASGADSSCCAPVTAGLDGETGANGSRDTERQFAAFLRSASQPKALDAASKQAIAIALATMSRCEPCLKAHIEKAQAMGFTREEIDDAAWSAIAFGGSPVWMFYKSVIEAAEAG